MHDGRCGNNGREILEIHAIDWITWVSGLISHAGVFIFDTFVIMWLSIGLDDFCTLLAESGLGNMLDESIGEAGPPQILEFRPSTPQSFWISLEHKFYTLCNCLGFG